MHRGSIKHDCHGLPSANPRKDRSGRYQINVAGRRGRILLIVKHRFDHFFSYVRIHNNNRGREVQG